MTEQATRYPLSWPRGWVRTRSRDRKRAQFARRVKHETMDYKIKKELSVAQAIDRLSNELRRLAAGYNPIVSTNIRTRLDGLPYSNAAEPEDPGVAVYFQLKGKPRTLACDRWDRVADNIAAIAAHIDAIRAVDRYGVGTLEQAFAGYAQLPAATRQWWDVLGVDSRATIDDVDEAYRILAKTAHPDAGGTHERMAELNAARDAARKALT